MSETGAAMPQKLNITYAFACVPILIAAAGLVGWVLDIEMLKSLRPGMTAINPMTAIALAAIGLATVFHRLGRIGGGQILGVCAALIGIAKLAAMATGVPSIDGLLFAAQISVDPSGVGRMAPNAAVTIVLLGGAAVFAGRQKHFCILSQILAALAASIALFALVGYAYGVDPLYTIGAFRPMAFQSSLAFIAGAVALGSLHNYAITGTLKQSGPAGSLARTVLPLAIAIPVVVGGARLWGQRLGFYGLEVGVSLEVIANVGLTCSLIAGAIHTISKSDKSRLERESDLKIARRKAEDALRAKSSFLANMSHEIRTPLNGVIGFAQLLATGDLDEEQLAQAKMVHTSALGLLSLLNDILDFSKIEAGTLETNAAPTCLPSLLQQCMALVEPIASAKGVATFVHIHDDVPGAIMIDPMRVRQIALNLLGNSVKFTNKGFIAIDVSRKVENGGAERLIVRIHDTGIGIPAERLEDVFTDFVQADATISRHYGGSGLGLSISRSLAELLGGSIRLESEYGRGTKVELELPLHEIEAAPPVSQASAITVPGTSKFRVLVVEDNEVNQRLATAMLKKLGHEVDIAEDGLAAVHKMHAVDHGAPAFDLVFMDIQLPHLSGMEATTRIRALRSGAKVPIVALSANAYASDIADYRKAGMNDHVAKPYTLEALSDAVDRWSGSRFPKRSGPSAVRRNNVAKELRPLFLEQCSAAAEKAESLVIALQCTSDETAALVLELQSIAHKLSGTAASFEAKELGRIAAETEEALKCLTPDAGSASYDAAENIVDQFLCSLRAFLTPLAA